MLVHCDQSNFGMGEDHEKGRCCEGRSNETSAPPLRSNSFSKKKEKKIHANLPQPVASRNEWRKSMITIARGLSCGCTIRLKRKKLETVSVHTWKQDGTWVCFRKKRQTSRVKWQSGFCVFLNSWLDTTKVFRIQFFLYWSPACWAYLLQNLFVTSQL